MAEDYLIGRKREQEELDRIMNSGRPEFAVVYGRRRIGKTFLINKYFNENFAFKYTGIAKKNRKVQLARFAEALRQHGLNNCKIPKDWFEAFVSLKELLIRQKKSKRNLKRQVVFIDELPFMDTKRSNLVAAIENFWNDWGCNQNHLVLIVCGSATGWMTKKIIRNHGGLHNRLTAKIYLHPFTLNETRKHLKHLGVQFSDRDIMECYMIMGGVPFYQSLLQPGLSLAQNIDRLMFDPHGYLATEFDDLYASLFESSADYVRIIEALSKVDKGITRAEIIKAAKLHANGKLTTYLEDLQNCDIIRSYPGYGKTKRQSIFQLTDFYTRFYFKFLKQKSTPKPEYWIRMNGTQKHSTWCGLAFEQLCLAHYPQIEKALGISGINTEVFSWISNRDKGGAQIDLIIKRSDRIVNICEMKYYAGKYRITQKDIDNLENKISNFREENSITSAIHVVVITSNGLANPEFSSLIQRSFSAMILFEE